MNVDAIIDGILSREGGYVDHPADRGGPTKYGITLARLESWRGTTVTAADVAALSVDEARAIYLAHFIQPLMRLEFMPDVFAAVVDIAVMSGPKTAVRLLQSTLNGLAKDAQTIAVDGVIGPETVMAVVRQSPHRVVQGLVKARLLALVRLVELDHDQLVFLPGWVSRTLSFLPEVA